jgi:hypothetical protein
VTWRASASARGLGFCLAGLGGDGGGFRAATGGSGVGDVCADADAGVVVIAAGARGIAGLISAILLITSEIANSLRWLCLVSS